MSKLTPAIREEIVQAYRAGTTSRALGKKYGLHHAYIRCLFQRMGFEPSDREGRIPPKRASLIATMAKMPGLTARQLAKEAGVSHYYAILIAKREGYVFAKGKTGPKTGSFYAIPVSLADALAPHAALRGITVGALVAAIAETVAMHGLVDAVLDDRAEAA